jgi:hypothetical protein
MDVDGFGAIVGRRKRGGAVRGSEGQRELREKFHKHLCGCNPCAAVLMWAPGLPAIPSFLEVAPARSGCGGAAEPTL